MMKRCNACGELKEISQFRKDNRIKCGRQGRCKQCVSEKAKIGYQTKYREKTKQRSQQQRDQNRQLLNEYLKDKQCEHCGNTNPIVFEFHHTNPNEKEFTIGLARGGSWKTLLREIVKCQILCANCHRIEHWRLRQEETGK